MAIAMLIAIGISFAAWDITAVKATNGDLSSYANAKVGESVFFGQYYQTGEKDPDDPTEYKKTPIEWIVVDKDERTGQLTLMTKYILAAGSYFGNNYKNTNDESGSHYDNNETLSNIPYNQAYVDSTVRAYLNNLERRDMGGDSYSIDDGYKTGVTPSVKTEKLYVSVGFSNRRYNFTDEFIRPISNAEYKNRPATRGFYDEAFSNDEKAMIVPKVIAGYTGHRWPNNLNNPQKMSYVESVVDKVWIPSAAELNNIEFGDTYTNPSDAAGSTVFEYCRGKTGSTLYNALKTIRTELAKNSFAMNYSIPVYLRDSTTVNTDIHATNNSTDHYWTRSARADYYANIRYVPNTGMFSNLSTYASDIGVRPCVILKY